MAEEKKLPEGIRVFNPHANAPDFVIASVVVTPDALMMFCQDNPDLLSEYNGLKQIRLQLLKSQAGKLYMAVDTYKKEGNYSAPPKNSTSGYDMSEPPIDDLPF